MNDLERSNYLAHYGVVGMKWGVRRTPEQLGRASSKKSNKRPFISLTINKGAKKTESRKEAKAKAKAAKRNPRADMSDDQLSAEVKRLRLESEHKRLISDLYPQKQSVIKKLVTDAAINTGRLALNKIGENIVNNAFKEKFNPKDYEINDVSKADPKKLKKALEYKRDQAAYTRMTKPKDDAPSPAPKQSSSGPKKYKVSRSSIVAKRAQRASASDPWSVRNRRSDRHKSQAQRVGEMWPFGPPSTKPVGRRTARQAEMKQQKKQQNALNRSRQTELELQRKWLRNLGG